MSSKALKHHERIKQSFEKKVGIHAKPSDMDNLRTAANFLKYKESCHDHWVNERKELSQKVQILDREDIRLQGK